MIRKIQFIITITIMTVLTAWGQAQSRTKPPRQSILIPPPVKLDITGLKPIGLRKNPSALLVTWTEELRSTVRIVQYEITLVLSGKNVKEKTVQFANSGVKNYAISLDRIPADKRAIIFNSNTINRADVIIKAHYAENGRISFKEAKFNMAIAPPSLDGIFK